VIKKYISFVQVNSVPTKENGCEDVTHDVDDVLMHEIAEILIVWKMKMVC
jgi:hypothetical protein